jgi:hypothetical protein
MVLTYAHDAPVWQRRKSHGLRGVILQKLHRLAVTQSSTTFSPCVDGVCSPPSTTTPPLTAQHAWCARPRARSDVCSHRSSPRSSVHTALDISSPVLVYPPHNTSPGRVRSHTLAPSREALHTPVSRHAPTRPLRSATRVQNSGRATTREVAHLAEARVVGAIAYSSARIRIVGKMQTLLTSDPKP